jgi:hypothetical protein
VAGRGLLSSGRMGCVEGDDSAVAETGAFTEGRGGYRVSVCRIGIWEC